MFQHLRNPGWIDRRLYSQSRLEDIPSSLFEEINDGLRRLRKDEVPLVSVVIPALNEEVTILRTLHSISRNQTDIPVEVIVVNNNSTDRTQVVLDRLEVRSFLQIRPGWGPARQMGQEMARGKYILMADADCFYPPRWIELMTQELQKEGVTCVYGGYSFLAEPGERRWKYVLYEGLRKVISRIREYRRPWYNTVGMCMGYVRDLGLKVGFVNRKIRGEDGRMAYDLSQLGRIVKVRSREVVVWTFPRTLQRDGGLLRSLLQRVVVEFTRFVKYFRRQPAHDTHTSPNTELPTFSLFRRRRPLTQGDGDHFVG
jgi:glycosyltransferase involved in cell wall biosynthesis